MAISRFWSIPEKRKIAAGILLALIVIFLLVLIVRSCRKPEGESSGKYLQNLTGPAPENRLDAVLGLGRIGAKGAVPALESTLTSDPDERVRRGAAYSILILDREKFLKLLDSPDSNIRALALETIGRKEKEKAYPYLVKSLSDPSLLVRRTALSFLSQVPGPEASGAILRLAERTAEDSSLRVEALLTLSRRAGPEMLDRLKDLAGYETEPAVKAAATAVVKEIEAKKEAGK